MMKPRSKFWQSIAYDQYAVPTAPGYALRYFTSYEEFDQYISEHVDANWKDTEWGKFLLTENCTEVDEVGIDVSMNRYQGYIEYLQGRGAINNAYVSTKNNYEHLARDVIRDGFTDIDALMYIIGNFTYTVKEYTGSKTQNYVPSKKTLSRYVQKYTKREYKQPTKQTPKHIVRALAEYYLDQKMSLRETSRLMLENDDIRISYERIRELTTE